MTNRGSDFARSAGFVETDFACRGSLGDGRRAGLTASGLPRRSSAKPSEVWLAALDDFRNWLIREAA